MPAAMPHTRIALRSSADRGNSRASQEANQAEICTIGPSLPTAAPVPTDSRADRLRTNVVRSFSTYCPSRAASI